ncbi:MAG TPA: AEC family transporter [Opitutaceae bacterium]|nr:AEC family transporter [Opitutaceae bacterium]
MSFWTLLLLILPVFALMGLGMGLRRVGWLTAEADASLLRLVVNFLYPCIIFENVHANPALRDPANLAWGPFMGFATMAGGIVLCRYVARWFGFELGTGLRTFAFTAGIYNYAYITVPMMTALFGTGSLGVLFAFNVGAEAAIWIVGVMILAGKSWREGWRQLLSPPVLALFVAVGVNLTGLGSHVPKLLLDVVHPLSACAIPMGLILSGATMAEHFFGRPAELFEVRTSLAAVGMRLGVMTGLLLLLARYGPFTADLRHVIMVQAAMPAGFLPIVLVKHYGGHLLTAVRIVLATVIASILLTPFWLQLGLAWIG